MEKKDSVTFMSVQKSFILSAQSKQAKVAE